MDDQRPQSSGQFGTSDDTIAAVATAPGRGAISIVRVSGTRAHEVVSAIVDHLPAASRVPTLMDARDPRDGSPIDRLLVTRFDAPRSYTGEPMVELSGHGGYAAPAALLDALVAAGARPANPGEFTRRAVLNGKLDLVQAEAIGDLVEARSDAMRRAAVGQLDGGLSRRIAALRDALLDLEALLAYDIDFPEEDDGPVARSRVDASASAVVDSLTRLLATAPAGALVRQGAVIVIAGAPNAGKSSLFNALLGERRAIVAAMPGTTRDAIEATVDHAGWPLRLVDTAGLRDTGDVVERLGIEVSEHYLGLAHVVVACGDDDRSLVESVKRVQAHSEAPIVAVLTKRDAVVGGEVTAIPEAEALVRVSAETGEGLSALLDALARTLSTSYGTIEPAMPVLTRTRHVRAIAEAHDELVAFRSAWRDDALPASVAAVHVRQGVHALEELIGAVDVEDVLTRVFEGFCVGK